MITLTSHATVEELNAAPGNYVILSGGLNESYPELSSYLNTSTNYTLVCSHEYTPALTRGVETWKLYRRVSAKPAVPSPHHQGAALPVAGGFDRTKLLLVSFQQSIKRLAAQIQDFLGQLAL